MRLFTFAQQDGTIYQQFPTRNTGIDEILHAGKDDTTDTLGVYIIRSLLQFDLTAISSSLVSGTMLPSARHYLNLNIANAQYISPNQQVLFYPVSESWSEGTGYFYQDVQNPENGVCWTFRTVSGSNWATTGSSYINAVSASITIPQTITLDDLRVDVTNIVQGWLSGTYANNGILVKLPDSDETSSLIKTNIQFFSNQTHTIYRPTLESAWSVQSYVTGNLFPAPAEGKYIAFKNLYPEYSLNTQNIVRIISRPLYVQKSFDNVSRYNFTNYLPSSSYFSIIDAQTNKKVIPYDSYSLINCDASGSYFVLDTSALYPNRLYKIGIMIVSNGNTEIFEPPVYFKTRIV